MQLRQAPQRNATGAALQVGKVGVVNAGTGRTPKFATDRTGGTAKAFSNGSELHWSSRIVITTARSCVVRWV